MKKKIVVAVTGASGSIYAQRLFHKLSAFPESELEVGVVLSKNAPDVWQHELEQEIDIPFPIYDRMDYRAPFASGSAKFMHMIIMPCSMGTLGRIASGFSDDLTTRAADVISQRTKAIDLCDSRYPH